MNGPNASWYARQGLGLLTDLYQLTMSAGQWLESRADRKVCFEYVFRSLPPHGGYAVAAGLDPFLDYLEHLRFYDDDLAYLRSLNLFDEGFLSYLAEFRPACTVRAVPEGTVVFPHEPIVQAEGTILEVQLIETALLNFMNYQTLIATKAARICQAAEGEPVLEFGLRRAHGPDGGLSGSRAAFIGGCESTSNVLAGKVYGIPVQGTHAHSWVMSFPSELEAFRAFAARFPERCVLLVDTYDTLESGVPNAIEVFNEMRAEGKPVRAAIRLDSGDLAKLSKEAHRMMTDAGHADPLIVGSNDLDEDLIADLKRQGATINAWGVGTHLITSKDCPALGGVYKLVAIEENGAWIPRMKTTSNVEKSSDPGRKQVVRYYNGRNQPIGDVLYQLGEPVVESGEVHGASRSHPATPARLRGAVRSEPMLQTVFENGKRTFHSPEIEAIRNRALEQVRSLPGEYTRLRNPEVYRVLLSERSGRIKADLIADANAYWD